MKTTTHSNTVGQVDSGDMESGHAILRGDEVAFRDKCRTFASEVIAPNYVQFDRENRFPDVIHEEAHKRRLLNVCFPRELGGEGVSFKAMAEGGYEMAKVCPATTFTMGYNHDALRPVMLAGTKEQLQVFVRDHIERDRGYTALALTEADVAGSNLLELQTRADRTDGGWVISGTKCMVGMGTVAQQYMVLANTYADGRRLGLSFFVIPRTDGVEVGENSEKLGMRTFPTPKVTFHEVALGPEHLIGEAGHGETILFETLDFIRYGGGIVILGAIEGALRDAVPWLCERQVHGGVKLIEKSHVQLAIGNIYAQLEALRLLLRRAADLLDRRLPVTQETSALKLLGSQLAVKAAHEVVQMYGWRGTDSAYPVQKRLRDAQQMTIFEGTSEILKHNFFAKFMRHIRSSELG